MRIRGPFHFLRARWLAVVVMTAIGLLAGLAYTATAPVTYRASASAFFSLTAGDTAADLVQGSTYAQNQVGSFAQLATTPAVLQPVIDSLDLNTTPADLAGEVQASVPVGTVIVELTVTDTSSRRSAQLANAVIASLDHLVERLAPKNSGGDATVNATTVTPAVVPTSPASPNAPLDLVAAIVAGLALGVAFAWARDRLDTRVRDAEALAELTELPLIGSIGGWTGRGGSVVVASSPHSPQAESFRQVRTNLQFLRVADGSAEDRDGAHVMQITSALPGEGKSTIAANLAAALAETGADVLLMDADLRRPAVAQRLGIEGGVGLTTVLAGDADVQDVLQEWGPSGLRVLPSGPVPPNPAELLGSPAMRRLVGQLRRRYDYVVIDSAPLLPVADATVLSREVDGTVLVAQAGRLRRAQLVRALSALDQVSANVFGLVLNQVRGTEESYTYRPEDVPAGPGRTRGAPAGGQSSGHRLSIG